MIDFRRLKPLKEILWRTEKFSVDEVKGKWLKAQNIFRVMESGTSG